MPLYIPWLTETIKKRGVRYLLHHYLGQFFLEKLTLEQLSIDIYEGKGSIRNLALDVDGLNDELDFIPFTFLDGCSIGQISVEVPWSSLATEACRVELDGAKFVCRIKTSSDANKAHCTESTLLSRSLMTSSMQMAEEIVTTEDDDEYDSPDQSSTFRNTGRGKDKKDANQMFEGLEMFAQLIDSVLRRTKLTARNTLFRIQPHRDEREEDEEEDDDDDDDDSQDGQRTPRRKSSYKSSNSDEFSEPLARSDAENDENDDDDQDSQASEDNQNPQDDHSDKTNNTVEFFIKFFRCEEIVDQTGGTDDESSSRSDNMDLDELESQLKKSSIGMPETVTKLLTLEDVEMRIGGIPVSNLIGKHTITIKFNGHKSEISIFSGSPLLAVISHKQLETFFNVFDSVKDRDLEYNLLNDKDQKVMSPEDYAKIENQLLESASLRNVNNTNDFGSVANGATSIPGSYYVSSHVGSGRRWVDASTTPGNSDIHQTGKIGGAGWPPRGQSVDYDYRCPNTFEMTTNTKHNKTAQPDEQLTETTLENIEAFSCELKLPGIWLCILRDGEALPPLIKPYADSINSFQTINKYIDEHIKVPHIRCLALKVALDLTSSGINIFLADLDISEYLQDESKLSPKLRLLHNDLTTSTSTSTATTTTTNSARYKATIVDNREITLDLFTKTRVMFDPTMIDRIVYDYKLVKLNNPNNSHGKSKSDRRQSTLSSTSQQRMNNNLDLNLTIRGEQFKLELLCPIPDLTPEAHLRATQLRPQSFLFDFKDIQISWQSDKLNISSNELLAYVKTQPKQTDNEAIKFIESTGRNNDKINLILEPSPSNLDTEFPNEIEHALNESSLYDSIYVSQATESRIPTEPFQTKRKVVRASFESQKTSNKPDSARISECDHEKILTPGDRQHLLDYLHQTVMSTKMSLSLHLPVCEVEFEDKEQLDLIYNRFGNDFVFWQPRAFLASPEGTKIEVKSRRRSSRRHSSSSSTKAEKEKYKFKQPKQSDESSSDEDEDANDSDNSYHSAGFRDSSGSLQNSGDCYDNQVTCKIMVDELFVRFNHQSCAAAMKQEISADNLLLGVVIDVNKKPNTLLSLVADNLELSTDSDIVLEGNTFGDKSSTFGLTAEIKRPTKSLKDIKLAIQLKSGLFNDFKSETYKRFWQSINVTDEPILGYVAPRIVTELHIDILNTCLLVTKEGARPALLAIDELYLTSMVMEETSQVMIRLIADEVALYLKRNRDGFEQMKNYICLIDSGLIDLDVKFSQDGSLQFGVINNVITVRVCQDSLSALCKLFNVITRGDRKSAVVADQLAAAAAANQSTVIINSKGEPGDKLSAGGEDHQRARTMPMGQEINGHSEGDKYRDREMNLLADAMNDYNLGTSEAAKKADSTSDTYGTAHDGDGDDDDDDEHYSDERDGSETDEGREDDDDPELDDDDDDDDDGPPMMQEAPRGTSKQCKPSSCILDESNPMLGDLFSAPLLPLPQLDGHQNEQHEEAMMNQSSSSTATSDKGTGRGAMCESGFFVIGDDDVGAGIIDKQRQHEPVVRKLIDGPINIIDNHFKMTKPRTIPEMLANSLERYVLEEMTLVVNLYGGRDFDDEDPSEDGNSTTDGGDPAGDQAELIGGVSSSEAAAAAAASGSGLSAIRSRTGSLAAGTTTVGIRKQTLSDLNGSLKRKGSTGGGARRKHLSEGSGGGGGLGGLAAGGRAGDRSSRYSASIAEPRVRFGEGAVNLWESLDLMSSPDFLGARQRPSQPALNSDLKQAGGTWRQGDVCIQLTLSKMKLLYELADVAASQVAGDPSAAPASGGQATLPATRVTGGGGGAAPISWRFMLFIHDIEVKDRIAASDINKMLYEYCTESMPRRSTQFLTINNTATINPTDGCEECDLRVSLKPLRLNIDQDTLVFLIEFFNTFCKSLTKQQQQQQQQSIYPGTLPATVTTTTTTTSAPAKSAPGTYTATKSNSTTISCRDQRDAQGKCESAAAAGGGSGQVRSGRESQHLKQTREKAPGPNGLEQQNDVGACSSLSASNRTGAPRTTTTTTTTTTITSGAKDATKGRQAPEDLPSSPSFSSPSSASASASSSSSSLSGSSEPTNGLPTHCHKDNVNGSANQQPIYIKSFTFSPDVPIRLDYHAKHLDFEQGALAGILMGLAHLDHSELILRRVQAKHGMRGLDRVLLFALNSWLNDIKRNQLPSILSGVGPMHSVIQLFQGMRDLIWMPIDHYRKDKRLVRGLQRGASSFSSSTAMAAINLVNRFISIVQCTAQIAHDIVTPPNGGPGDTTSGADGHRHHHHHHSHRHHGRHHNRRTLKALGCGGGGAGAGQSMSSISDVGSRRHHHHRHSNSSSGLAGGGGTGNIISQPRNFCEGVAVGFTILKEGFEDTARNVTVGMQAEDMRSAVGELVRQIPSTLLNPIISATEGAQSVLVGIRNQIAPDARREDQEKWKRRVRGK